MDAATRLRLRRAVDAARRERLPALSALERALDRRLGRCPTCGASYQAPRLDCPTCQRGESFAELSRDSTCPRCRTSG